MRVVLCAQTPLVAPGATQLPMIAIWRSKSTKGARGKSHKNEAVSGMDVDKRTEAVSTAPKPVEDDIARGRRLLREDFLNDDDESCLGNMQFAVTSPWREKYPGSRLSEHQQPSGVE
jgi:hypothetical protein